MPFISVPILLLKVKTDRLTEKLKQRENTRSARLLFAKHLTESQALQTEYETMCKDIDNSLSTNHRDYKESYLYLLEYFCEYLFELTHHLKACAEECNLDDYKEKKDAQHYLRQALDCNTLAVYHLQDDMFTTATVDLRESRQMRRHQCTILDKELRRLIAQHAKDHHANNADEADHPPTQSSAEICSNKKRPATEVNAATFFVANKKQQTESRARSSSLFLKQGTKTMALIEAYQSTHPIKASSQHLADNPPAPIGESVISQVYQSIQEATKYNLSTPELRSITLRSVTEIMTYPDGLDLHRFIADPAFTEALKITALNLYSQYFPNQLLLPNASGQSILHTAIDCDLPQLALYLLQSPYNASLRRSRDSLNRNFLVFTLSVWRLALYESIKEQINAQDVIYSQPLIETIANDLQHLVKNKHCTDHEKQNIEHLSMILDSLKLTPAEEQYPHSKN